VIRIKKNTAMKLTFPLLHDKPNLWFKALQLFSFATLLLGIRLWIIGYYGNATPFWDQWDGEAANLYKPFFSDKLGWANLFSPHTNHRIFTTRLLDLTLLKINTLWNPMLQMVVNAIIHVFTLTFGLTLLSRITGINYLPVLLLFSFALFGIPFAWENILCGFQCQFYFLLLFSFASLWFFATKNPFSPGWFGGLVCAVLSFFSLASGVFVFGSAVLIGLFIYFFKVRRTSRQIISTGILFILFLIFLKITPVYDSSEKITVKSFYSALTTIYSWPFSNGLFAALFCNFPIITFLVILIRKPFAANDKKWFLVALIIWSAGQALSIAYGRSSSPLVSRYLDLFTISLLVNFVCLVSILRKNTVKWKNSSILITCLWILPVFISLLQASNEKIPIEMEAKKNDSLTEEIKTRNYLASGDTSYLSIKERLDIPYPFADRLELILSWPEIRKILPANINPGMEPGIVKRDNPSAFIKNGYYSSTTGYLDSAWGSYNSQGDAGEGTMSLSFETNQPGVEALIPVAGYPLSEGMQLAIEQDGQSNPIFFSDNPKEKWMIAKVKLKKGPFTIYASDNSKNTWLAVGKPVLKGRLDNFIDQLLSHYSLFLLMGLITIIILLIIQGFNSNAGEHTKLVN
jgi:hypothetical protein